MDTRTTFRKCEEFLASLGTHHAKDTQQKYANYFEQFRSLNSLWGSKNINDQDSLKLCEAWNSVLSCYKVALERMFEVLSQERAFAWGNSRSDFCENLQKNFNSQINTTYSADKLSSPQLLYELLDLIKELTFICESMKSSLENNIGLTNSSSTNTLSIALLLVNIICYRIETDNHDFLNKVYGSTLYCLNILFRIYKVEFTESWDLILFPERVQVSYFKDVSTLFGGSSIDKISDSDIPFLIYFLFSSNTKVRVNSILCIQSIFAAPIFRFKSMISLLCKPFSQQVMDTSASSLSKNAVILTFSLLKFAEITFKSESYDLDTFITLIKAISKVVNTTPLQFWTCNFLQHNISFIQILSNILLLGLKDFNLTIPSLQLFSNILSLMKNCDTSKKELFDCLYPSFEQVIVNSSIILGLAREPNGNINGKNLQAKCLVILAEILNFYIRLLEDFPFLLLIVSFKQSLVEESRSEIKNYLLEFVDLLELINLDHNELDQLIYEKALRTTYLFVDYIRNFWKMYLSRNDIEYRFHLSEHNDFFQNIKGFDISTIYIEETYLKIFNLLKSFILYTFDIVIENLVTVKEITNSSNSFRISRSTICRMLDIYSTISPVILEESFLQIQSVSGLSDNGGRLIRTQNEEINEYFTNSSKVNFVELLLLLLRSAEDKLLTSIVSILLCYCSNSEWLKYSSFKTFQCFEATLVKEISLLISPDRSISMGPIRDYTILSVNRAIIHICMYHSLNIHNVIYCSSIYRRSNLKLIEESYNNFIEDCGIELNEDNCLLNWKEMYNTYKLLIQYFEADSNSLKAVSHSNFSETIRAFGRILKLIPFSLDDSYEVVWTLELLNNLISKTYGSSLRLNKVKWNSIYVVGLLFESYHFNNIVIQSFYTEGKTQLDVLNSFSRCWKTLCLLIKNESELSKVRLSALRSLTANINKNDSNYRAKIPYIVLFETWDTYKYALSTQLSESSNLVDKYWASNGEYSSMWNLYLNKLGSMLYESSIFYIRDKPNSLTSLDIDLISKYCSEALSQSSDRL
ncbi:hypothetical protein OJ252_1043 [Cryptosporidium canis]|uniref:Uncharacterized protein n=1 Tax=Cryptosporidium canis TaxID=195482 RepID=A0ABQ8P985_9CRYT|nr:hypothetical protein OJ252_1043 [Cryptosporidium canis]